MKAFRNVNVGSIVAAIDAVASAQNAGESVAFSGGGSDLLQLMKDGTQSPDVLINLREIDAMKSIRGSNSGTEIGGSVSLEAIAQDVIVAARYEALAQAAASVATPQIRNVATLAGNVMQRPWCWYYRNGFNCYKAGGDRCYSVTGENQQHAIFGGGPSFIVHPSDLAPVLVAFGARFRMASVNGERRLDASEFFTLPGENPARENALNDGELLVSIELPAQGSTIRSGYHKVMDREAWTHAVVSAAVVLDMDGENCRSASIVLGGVAPIPWRLPEVESLLQGQRITEELAQEAGELAVSSANPLSKNAYKLPMTAATVARTLLEVAAS